MTKPLSFASVQISPRQFRVLNQVGHLQASQCCSVTIGELAQTLNISRATAFEHIAALREKNLLTQSTGKARCLRLAPSGEKLLKQSLRLTSKTESVSMPADCTDRPQTDLYLRGRVSAGYGIDAIEEQTPFSLSGVFGNRDEMFVLQVKGQSMVNAGIHDGDFVMCRSAQTAENGQLVVALLEDGQNATLKRFYKDTQAVRLQPENDAFEPILSRNCKIQAVVVGLIRKFGR
jgi:repressor LexA